MSVQSFFKEFHGAVALSWKDDAYRAAREKGASLLCEITAAMKDAGYEVQRHFRQGSHSKLQTAIYSHDGSDFDIDQALVIKSGDAPDDPVTVKKVVKKVLEDRRFKNATIKKPCITADYSSQPLHFDYPVYKEDVFGDLYLAVGREHSNEDSRQWEHNDPEGLIDWLTARTDYTSFFGLGEDLSDAEYTQFRRLVRYLKRWRDVQFSEGIRKHIYSIGLTVMARKCFRPSVSEDGVENDLESLTRTVAAILDHGYFTEEDDDTYSVEVRLPVEPCRDIFADRGTTVATQFYRKLTKLHEKLEKTEAEASTRKQCELLQKQFGQDFPVPEEDDNRAAAAKRAAVMPQVVGHHQGA